MRRALLIISTVILYCAITNAGGIVPGVENPDKTGILYDGKNYIITGSEESQLTLPAGDELTLDVPVNDDYENAEAIGEVHLLPFNLAEATFDGPGEFIKSRNIWYRYTPSVTGSVEISSFWSELDGKIAVYNGDANFDGAEPVIPVALAGGETIETATAVSGPLPVAVSGSIEGYAHDYDLSEDCAGNTSLQAPDVVYSYTPDTDTSVNVFLFNDSGNDVSGLILKILDAQGNELACDADWDDWLTVKILNFPVTAGQTYYFVVTDANSPDHEYVLQVSSPAYQMLDCSDNYYILFGSLAKIDVVAGEEYLIEVSGKSRLDSWAGVLSVSQLPPPPANDDCENAMYAGILEAGNPISMTFDNVEGATVDCLPGCYMPEIWISFTIEEAMDVNIDYCGTENSGFMSSSILAYTSCPCDPDGNSFLMNYDTHYCDFGSGALSIYRQQMPPGTYYYPVLTFPLTPDGSVFEIRLTANQRQVCDDNTLFGQKPLEQIDGLYGNLSEIDGPAISADNFAGIDEPIGSVNWWAVGSSGHQYYGFCELDTLPFHLIFCEDRADLPGDTIAVYDVNAAIEFTGRQYLGSPEWKFTTSLNPPLDMEEGWLMITGDAPDTACWFYWMFSSVPGNSLFYEFFDDQWYQLDANFAFCLGEEVVSVDEPYELPSEITLSQNYPNPFNATTSIQFSLKQTDDVSLAIYDVGGRLIKALYNGQLAAGTHDLIWDGTNEEGQTVSSGIYFYRLNCSDKTFSKSMILLK